MASQSGRRNTCGFTLLETIISLLIVTAFALTITSVNATTNKVARQAELRSIMANAMMREMDSIVAVSQANRTVVTDQAFSLPAEVLAQFPSEVCPTGSYSIAPVAGLPNESMVTVTISWNNIAANTSATSSMSMSRIITSYQDLTWTYNGTAPIDPTIIFYTPPPPVSTTGSQTGTGTGGSGTTTGTTDGSGSTTGSTGTGTATGGSAGGGTTGGTGSTTPPSCFYGAGYGNKW